MFYVSAGLPAEGITALKRPLTSISTSNSENSNVDSDFFKNSFSFSLPQALLITRAPNGQNISGKYPETFLGKLSFSRLKTSHRN